MNDEALMSNDEGNPNDETRKKAKCSFRHLSSSLIRRFRLPRRSLAKAGRLQTDAIAAGTAATTDTVEIFANLGASLSLNSYRIPESHSHWALVIFPDTTSTSKGPKWPMLDLLLLIETL